MIKQKSKNTIKTDDNSNSNSSSASSNITTSSNNNQKKINIIIKKINYEDNIYFSSLKLEFSGENLNYKYINSLRRVSLDEIPIYAFPRELIQIEENTSIFDNDYVKLRLSQLPILNTNNKLFYLNDINIHYDNDNYIKNDKDDKIIEIYINGENNTQQNINITTENIKYVENDKIINDKYSKEHPILLIQLRPTEKIKAHMKAVLSTGIKSNIFSAASNCFYDYDNEKNILLLTIESQGQLTEKEILIKSCEFILKKLNDFKTYFIEKKNESKNLDITNVTLEFENEDYTIGDILNDCIQDHPKIISSGMAKISPLERNIIIKINSIDNNLYQHVIDSCEYLINVYNIIMDELKEL
jgi:DNA-directed RNA polymerase subunit L